MQIILKQNVPHVGRKLDVVNVSNGYANNFLFPKGLAEPATESKIAELEKLREAMKVEEEEKQKAVKEKFDNLKDASVVIKAKTDDQGHLYKKIHVSDILEAVNNDLELGLEESSILLDAPLHEVGEHEVKIELMGNKATVIIKIEKEEK